VSQDAVSYYANASLLEVVSQVAAILGTVLMFYQHLRKRWRARSRPSRWTI